MSVVVFKILFLCLLILSSLIVNNNREGVEKCQQSYAVIFSEIGSLEKLILKIILVIFKLSLSQNNVSESVEFYILQLIVHKCKALVEHKRNNG